MTPGEYLSLPYTRTFTPDESGRFVAGIQEFPGCIADGATIEEAIVNLDRVAEAWIESALETGYGVPPPTASIDYSGRIMLRLPRALHRTAAEMAKREETSLNQLLVAAVAYYIGSMQRSQLAPEVVAVSRLHSLTATSSMGARIAIREYFGSLDFERLEKESWARAAYDLISDSTDNVVDISSIVRARGSKRTSTAEWEH